ncbi:MAG: glycine cleavage system protein H, partial [Chloroflexi bacterium]|nr:glycine cleavage system protein H [Chloroflexota bacterium]
VRVGGSDFLQKKNGDVAFVEPRATGTRVAQGEEFGQIETIKALVSLVSPVTGEIIEVNDELEARPELVNEDPYGEGWIVRIKAEDFARDRERLLEPGGYFVLMQEKIKEELGKKK